MRRPARLIDRIPGHRGAVYSVAFSPDGREEVALASEGLVELWDLKATPRPVRTIPCHGGFVYAVAFSPDGRYLASGGLDRTLRLWDRATGDEVRAFYGHEGFVRGLAFSPDGRWLLSASEDKSLKLWEVASGRPLADFHGHQGFTSCVAFSPDGRLARLGRARPRGQALARDVEPAAHLHGARRRGPRPGVQPRRPAHRFGGRQSFDPRPARAVGRDDGRAARTLLRRLPRGQRRRLAS